jgi:hypothetical protein
LKDRPRVKGIETKVLGEGAIELVVVDVPRLSRAMGVVVIQEEDSPYRPSSMTRFVLHFSHEANGEVGF